VQYSNGVREDAHYAIQSTTKPSPLRSCHWRGGPKHEGPELQIFLPGHLEPARGGILILWPQTYQSKGIRTPKRKQICVDKQLAIAVL
jgi:hypothetical protein